MDVSFVLQIAGTLPAELRGLARHNRAVVFDLLFSAASQTLLELGRDPKHLGALIGFTAAVLHTWKRDLQRCICSHATRTSPPAFTSKSISRYGVPRQRGSACAKEMSKSR
jgi:hypothetical protein